MNPPEPGPAPPSRPSSPATGRDGEDEGSRLDAIATRASLLDQAHHGPPDAAGPARNALVLRYRRAVRGYLGALLQDDQLADEVAHDILVRILEGRFAGADLSRGRFRDYLKRAVRNAALSALRSAGKLRGTADADQFADDLPAGAAPEQRWLDECRLSLLEGATARLAEYQRAHPGNVYATLLRLLAERPQDDSARLAERLREATGQPYRADAVRQQVGRARRKFALFLLDEVRRSLDDPSGDAAEAELTELGLMDYVRDFLPPDWREGSQGVGRKPE